MTQRPLVSDAAPAAERSVEMPPPDVAAFIRHCHARRGASWPELYDEMCAVASRHEFRGWDHDALEARGLTFSLWEMPRLAAWTRAVLASADDESLGEGSVEEAEAREPVLA